MGCLLKSKRARPPPVNPVIQIRPRYQLVSLSLAEKSKERDRLLVRINQKRIDFEEGSSELSDHAVEVLRNVAEVLMEYPEVDLAVEGHAGCRRSGRRLDKELALAEERAEVCREQLFEFGVVSDISLECTGQEEGLEHGCVRLRAVEAKLLEPQQRMDLILSRTGFDFVQQTDELTERGFKTAGVLARVLKETSDTVWITVPKNSSDLACRRAEAIAMCVQEQGVNAKVKVRLALGNQDRATVTIDAKPDLLGPQGRLVEILKETPLAFRNNSAELAPEVLPAIRKCADVLKQVQCMSVLVEAYSGCQSPTGVSETRIRENMLARAERVVDWFQAEGVTVPLHARGYSGAFADGNMECRGPRVVLTLVSPGEEELEMPEFEENEDGGCMGDRGNFLGCL